ncbi:hypothetical protein J4457_03755 [Candidatus Woesearchaeota archaeon]|nr:hypothetical protein [Candidatus Woesearchaeota archaeon]
MREPTKLSKSGLAIVLSRLKGLEAPKVRFEQYQAPSELAVGAETAF